MSPLDVLDGCSFAVGGDAVLLSSSSAARNGRSVRSRRCVVYSAEDARSAGWAGLLGTCLHCR